MESLKVVFLLLKEFGKDGKVNMLVVNGHYEGFVVGKEKVHVPMLQFADDTLLFCKYDESILMKLKDTIALFEWCS